MSTRSTTLALLTLVAACQGPAQNSDSQPSSKSKDAGPPARELFNGVDLNGWVNVNCAASTWTWRDGMLICSGVPTGVLRSERMYQDFELELEWRHLQAGGNAGVFLMSDALPAKGQPFTRSIEVQVLDGTETENYTSHGDVFSIHGASLRPDRPHPAGWQRCLPSVKRARPSPEWNHYRIVCRNGTLKLSVNGVEVSGATRLTPRRGYLCIESEGSEVHFRNLRLRELPSTRIALTPAQVAQADLGFTSLYDGVSWAGWRAPRGAPAAHWSFQDWKLACDASVEPLWSSEEFGDCEWIVDVRAAEGRPTAVLHLRGAGGFEVSMEPKPEGQWSRVHVRATGRDLDVDIDGERSAGAMPKVAPRGPLGISAEGVGRLEFANLFVRRL